MLRCRLNIKIEWKNFLLLTILIDILLLNLLNLLSLFLVHLWCLIICRDSSMLLFVLLTEFAGILTLIVVSWLVRCCPLLILLFVMLVERL